MKHVNLYTYSSLKSPKAAKTLNKAVGYVLEFPTKKGAATRTETIFLDKMHNEMTKNQSHIFVVGMALSRINTKVELDLYTDCQYLYSVLQNGWLQQWKKNNWKTTSGRPIMHKADWKEFAALIEGHQIKLHLCEPHPYREWLEHEVEVERRFVKEES